MIESHNIGHFGKLYNYRGSFIEVWEVNSPSKKYPITAHGVSNIQRVIHPRFVKGELEELDSKIIGRGLGIIE